MKFEKKAALSDKLNDYRLKQFFIRYSKKKRSLLFQLPWFFELNTPNIVGYIPYAPSGFSIKPLTPFPFNRDILSIHTKNNEKKELIGLYLMGSLATLAQNSDSDIDCWLVYADFVSENRLKLLHKKIDLILNFFAHHHIKIHFYIIKENDNIVNENIIHYLSYKKYRTARNHYLLEEFYRSYIRLSGKKLIWWNNNEKILDHQTFISLGKLKPCLNQLLGITLSHIYRAINTPYKAAIKILLMESYTHPQYHDFHLRDEIWIKLCNNVPLKKLDHYLLMYYRIEKYLLSTKEYEKLYIIQKCFYLKFNISLQQLNKKNYKSMSINKLIKNWLLNKKDLKHLDNIQYWNINDLFNYYAELNFLIKNSYSRLTKFLHYHNIDNTVKLSELCILSHSIFGKQHFQEQYRIYTFNTLKHINLYEKYILIEKNDNTYYLYSSNLHHQKTVLLYTNNNLLKIILWGSINHIIASTTHIIYHNTNTIKKIKKIIYIITMLNNIKLNEIEDYIYHDVNHICNIIICHWQTKKNKTSKKHNYIDTDYYYLYQNKYNEFLFHEYQQEYGLLYLIQHIWSINNINNLKNLKVFSCSYSYHFKIEQYIQKIIDKLIETKEILSKKTHHTFNLILHNKQIIIYANKEKLIWQIIPNHHWDKLLRDFSPP